MAYQTLIGWVDHDLTIFAGAFASGADASFFFQDEMQDAPFARGHGVESERGVSFADAIGGDMRGKFKFLDAHGAITGCIESDPAPELGIQIKPPEGDVFERLQQFRVSFNEQVLIPPFEYDQKFRIFQFRRASRTRGANLVRKLKASRAEQRVDTAAKFRRGRRMIQLSTNDQTRASYGRQWNSSLLDILTLVPIKNVQTFSLESNAQTGNPPGDVISSFRARVTASAEAVPSGKDTIVE